MKGAINARLLSAAEMTRQDATFADIGTDHAYLPLFLLGEGRIKRAYCSDINEGPLASARKNAAAAGMADRMEFILADGASALAGKGITDYAICGMGGELIARIIELAPHLFDPRVNLILQPMSRQAHLRRYLIGAGFRITRESYSFDSGKYYVTLLATYSGECREIDGVEAELGAAGAEYICPEARRGYLTGILNARSRALRGKAAGGLSDIPEKKIIDAIRAELGLA